MLISPGFLINFCKDSWSVCFQCAGRKEGFQRFPASTRQFSLLFVWQNICFRGFPKPVCVLFNVGYLPWVTDTVFGKQSHFCVTYLAFWHQLAAANKYAVFCAQSWVCSYERSDYFKAANFSDWTEAQIWKVVSVNALTINTTWHYSTAVLVVLLSLEWSHF